jgi:hypothetical protein
MRHAFLAASLIAATSAGAVPETIRAVPAPMPSVPVADPVDPALRADIVKLMELTGSAELGRELASLVANAAFESFKSSHPQLPTGAYRVAQEVIRTEYGRGFADPDGFLATVIPIYAMHFNHSEIRALIAFYGSEVGKKNVALIPMLVHEYEELGKQWAVELTPGVQQALRSRLQNEGYVLN